MLGAVDNFSKMWKSFAWFLAFFDKYKNIPEACWEIRDFRQNLTPVITFTKALESAFEYYQHQKSFDNFVFSAY